MCGIRNPLEEDDSCPRLGSGHEQTCLMDKGTVVNAKLQGGTAEALRACHSEWERVFNEKKRERQNRTEVVLKGMVWSKAWPSCGSGKVWGIMAWTGINQGTHISNVETLMKELRNRSRRCFPTSEIVCKGPMDAGVHGLVDRHRGPSWW